VVETHECQSCAREQASHGVCRLRASGRVAPLPGTAVAARTIVGREIATLELATKTMVVSQWMEAAVPISLAIRLARVHSSEAAAPHLDIADPAATTVAGETVTRVPVRCSHKNVCSVRRSAILRAQTIDQIRFISMTLQSYSRCPCPNSFSALLHCLESITYFSEAHHVYGKR
jgi:hypothetical protein